MVEIIREGWIITRKPHHCWGCAREYPAGSRMNYSVSKDGDKIYDAYWCEVCEKFMLENDRHFEEECFEYGDFLNFENYPERDKIIEGKVKSTV